MLLSATPQITTMAFQGFIPAVISSPTKRADGVLLRRAKVFRRYIGQNEWQDPGQINGDDPSGREAA
jgi:hypothetical protein